MTDIDEIYINAIKGLATALNRLASALENHLPTIAVPTDKGIPVIEPTPATIADGAPVVEAPEV